MLGKKIGEEKGKITGMRVLPSDGGSPKVEVSFQAKGTILGLQSTDMGTYWSVVRSGGNLYGEGQGVVMTKGGGMATWVGSGAGQFTGRGSAAKWRGAIYYQTSSKKLAALNGIAVVFEYETDEEGNTQSNNWEWK